jgi:hypothetical protein
MFEAIATLFLVNWYNQRMPLMQPRTCPKGIHREQQEKSSDMCKYTVLLHPFFQMGCPQTVVQCTDKEISVRNSCTYILSLNHHGCHEALDTPSPPLYKKQHRLVLIARPRCSARQPT